MMEVVNASGERFALGEVEASATVGIIDYSRRVTDDFGVTTVVQRGFARRMSVRLAVPSDDASALQRRLADLRATSARWIADDRFDWLSPTGFYKDFDIDMAVPPLSYCTLSVEGLAQTEAGADPGGDPAPDGRPSTLQLLQPYAVTEAILTASSVAEDDAPAWAAATGYTKGAKVLRQHRVYEALVANSGADPLAAGGQWLDTGPSKRWAPFDQALGTVAQADGLMTMRLETARIEGMALLDVKAATVRVQADGYDRTQAVTGGAVTFLDLGGKGWVMVTIAGAGAVTVGTLLIGRVVALGTTEASPTAGITDFSRKTVDDFGEVTIVKRGFAKRMTAKALIRTDALDIVANRIATVRAMPSLWIGQDGLDCLTVYGFFRDFSVEIGPGVSKLSLSIEGLSAADKTAPLVSWPDLGDPDGTKPEDNATHGAPNDSLIGAVRQPDGTYIGGKLAGSLLSDVVATTGNTASLATNIGAYKLSIDPLLHGDDGTTLKTQLEQWGIKTETNDLFIKNLSQVDPEKGTAFALWSVGANGVASSITQMAGPGGAIQGFYSDIFVFWDRKGGGQPVEILRYEDGAWRFGAIEATRVKADVIEAKHIVSAAVQQTRFVILSADVSIPRNSTIAVATMTFTKDEATSTVRVQFFGIFWSGDDLQFSCSFVVDGATAYPGGSVNLILDNYNSNARAPITPFLYLTDLPAGRHTIRIDVTNNEDENIPLVVKSGSAMEIIELKKAAI